MFYRTIITIRAAFARWKARIADALLGYTARAGHIVADADARLIGMTPAAAAGADRSASAVL